MRRWLKRRPVEDFAAELDAHLELEKHDLMLQRGLSETDARLAARKAFGNVTASRERYYEARGWMWLDRLRQHIRYTLRGLRQRPGFGLAIVATLAIGIGLNTAIFTIAYSFLLRPLPVRDADRIVNVYQQVRGPGMREVHGTESMVSYPEFREYAAGMPAFASSAVYAAIGLAVAGAPTGTVRGQLVSCDYFRTFGVRIAIGRALRADECAAPGSNPVVVLSHGIWSRLFGSDSSIAGRVIRINTLPFTVVGVTEPGFAGALPESAEMWVPVTMQPTLAHGRDTLVNRSNVSWLVMAGHLAPGATIDQARSQAARVAALPDDAFPESRRIASVVPGAFFNFPEVRQQGTTALVLIVLLGFTIILIACANVVNLLLARGMARRREIGIRLALGASRWRLIEQLLIEALLLATVGAALGVALVMALPRVFRALVPEEGLQLSVAPDASVILYAFAVGVAAAVAAGLMPALQTTRVDLVSSFKGGTGIAGDPHGRLRPSTLRSFAVGVQMAGSALLLVMAALLFRAASRATAVDPGFATRNVVSFSMNLSQLGYDRPRAEAVYNAMAQRLRAMPDVAGVAIASGLPLLGSFTHSLTLEGAGSDERRPSVNVNSVWGSYFDTMKIPILRGRTFSEVEMREAGDRPAVVSRSLAAAIWPNAEAIGQRFSTGSSMFGMTRTWYRVVGIAAEARTVSLGEPVTPTAYLGGSSELGDVLVVRTTASPAAVIAELPKWMRLMDSQIAVRPELFEERIALLVRPAKLAAGATASLGAIAMLLASIGIASVIGFGVTQRRREVGIRLALGATAPSVVRLMMRQGAWAAGAGLGAGIVLAAGISMAIRATLFGLNPLDPVAYLATAVLLLGTALVAMYIPSRRAARTDPALTLREE